MDHQGTLSIDLLFTTFMVLIIIGYTSTLISDRFDTVDSSQELVEARSLAENIAGAINQAYAGGDGHTIKITMPAQINKNNYYIVIVNPSGVVVDLKGRKGLAYIIPEKISATETVLESSEVTLIPGKNYVIMNKKEGKEDNWIVILPE